MKMIKYITCYSTYIFLSLATIINGEENKKTIEQEKTISTCEDTEDFVETKHEVLIKGQPLSYRAVAGTLLLKDEKCQSKANLFYISYTKENVSDSAERPVTFCFNGGPGSSSVWLHLGAFGPQRIYLNDKGEALPPYQLVDNEYSLLDVTDLVFIDPVSTGFSHAIPSEDAKNFYGVEEDIKSIAEFIRLYLTRYNRWASPKFIAGESYGTTRAAGLAGYLHDHEFIYVNGIVLLSSVLNFQSIDFDRGNDLPYLLYLPAYTATAWYHQMLSPDLQKKDLQAAVQASRDFVADEYTKALFKGDSLTAEEKKSLTTKLSQLTGISPAFIDQINLRIDVMRFMKELLRYQKRTVGRFDSRFKGIDVDAVGEKFDYDPSAEAVFGAFTSAFNDYLRTDLKWAKEAKYKILTNVQPWNYGSAKYLNVADTLRDTITKNPALQVFVGNGYYDLATPFSATDYTFNHLGLDDSLAKHVTIKYYEAGHMMYIYQPALVKLKEDLAVFYQQALEDQQKRQNNTKLFKK